MTLSLLIFIQLLSSFSFTHLIARGWWHLLWKLVRMTSLMTPEYHYCLGFKHNWYGSFFEKISFTISSFVLGSLHLFSRDQLFATPWTAACQASLSINSQSLLKLMFIESLMPSNHIIFCHPLLLTYSIFPSYRVFSNESVLCIRWSKYWTFSISPSNVYSGLISFRMYWLDLLAVQGTLKSLLQCHSSKASILFCA